MLPPNVRMLGGSVFLCAALINAAALSQPANDPVAVEVTDRVLMETPARLGVNIGPNAYYDDRQMVARPFAHGEFNRGRQVGFMRVGSVRGQVVRDARYDPGDATTGYPFSFRGGRYCIATGPNAGETGAIVEHEAGTGNFQFERSGSAIATGEYIWLRGPAIDRAVPDPQQGEPVLGIGGFRVETAEGAEVDLSPGTDEDGDQAVRFHVPVASGYAGLKHYFIALPDTRYQVRVRARADSPGASLDVRFVNLGIPAGQPGQRIYMTTDDTALGTTWRDYEFEGETMADQRIGEWFSAIHVRVVPGSADLPVTAYVDSVELADLGIATAFSFSNRLVNTVSEARCGVLRFYGIASPGSLVEDITAARAEASSWSFSSGPGGFQMHPTHAVVDDWMRLCVETGANPWLTVGGANTPDDWYALISYLAAPAGFDEDADRRVSHGFEKPWSQEFESIYIEIGNEWWNRIFAPFAIDDPEQYAELCNLIIDRVKAHPHYDEDRLKLMAGGWAVNGHNWNVRLDASAEGHDFLTVAPYLAHAIDNAANEQAAFGALFADVEASFENGGRQTIDAVTRQAVAALNDTRLAIYELNTHVTGGEAHPFEVSKLCTSLGAGLAVLDQAFAGMTRWGADPISYFTYFQRAFGRGDDARAGLWGNLILARDGSHRPRPVWHGLRLANRFLIEGDLVEVHVTNSPSWDQARNGSVPDYKGLPYLKAYAFLIGEGTSQRANVLLLNRHLSDALPVRIQLPFIPAPRVNRAELGGTFITDHNEDYEKVATKESTIESFDSASAIVVPPHSATVLKFRATE